MELKIPASTATSSLLLACCIVGVLESGLARGTGHSVQAHVRTDGTRPSDAFLQTAVALTDRALGWQGGRALAAGPDGNLRTHDEPGMPAFGVTFDGDDVPCRPVGPRAACAQGARDLAWMSVHNAFRGSAAPGHFWSGAAISR